MTLAPQIEELREIDDNSSAETSVPRLVASSNGKRNPPARNTSRFWFERFLSVIQRQNPSIIDTAFVNQIAPNNEGKLLAQLKFLKIIDEQGKPTSLLPLLNLVGEEQKKGFNQMVAQSYSELFSEVKIDKAVADDLVNFFIRKYSFTRDKAVNASKFFLYLADKGAVQLSPELTAFLAEKTTTGSQTNGSTSVSSPRIVERPTRQIQRESRAQPPVVKATPTIELQAPSLQSHIQASIEIKLDKDTPKEYWDRVLALLGERKENEEQRQQENLQSRENAEQ